MSIRSGRMVIQAAAVLFGSNPDATHMAAAPLPPSDQDSIRRPKILQPGGLPLDQGWM